MQLKANKDENMQIMEKGKNRNSLLPLKMKK